MSGLSTSALKIDGIVRKVGMRAIVGAWLIGCVLPFLAACKPSSTAVHSDQTLDHEIALAWRQAEAEAKVTRRIAALRSDDPRGKGIQREWIGPQWVRERVSGASSVCFERVTHVYLGGTKVTDADIAALADLSELRELYLHCTAVTGDGLKSLTKMRSLRILHLASTGIADNDLAPLGSLKNLGELYLNDTRVTRAGIEKLRAQLPETEVID